MQEAYKLLIADDEKIIREGLAKNIDWNALGFCVQGVFSGGEEIIEYLKNQRADVLFTDVMMSHGTGLEAAQWINAYRPEMRVVLLTGYTDFETARQAIECRVVQHMITKPTQPAQIRHVFAQVLGELLIQNPSPTLQEPKNEDELLIQKLNQYVEHHLSSGVTLNELARYAHFTPSYLSRLFKEKTGENFTDCLTRIRIQQAKRLLSQSPLKISEIAKEVGYGDVRHFTQVFCRMVGKTPSSYRKSCL